jgi:hypothetical protein
MSETQNRFCFLCARYGKKDMDSLWTVHPKRVFFCDWTCTDGWRKKFDKRFNSAEFQMEFTQEVNK